jgi:hypothetical protein
MSRRNQGQPSRLSDAQIDAALDVARVRLTEGEWYPCNSFKIIEDFESLGLETDEQRLIALQQATAEVSAVDFDEPEPPGLSDEPACKAMQMIPFVWESRSFCKRMYFKFGIHRDGHLYVFSLHRADFEKKPTMRVR